MLVFHLRSAVIRGLVDLHSVIAVIAIFRRDLRGFYSARNRLKIPDGETPPLVGHDRRADKRSAKIIDLNDAAMLAFSLNDE